MLVFGLLGRYSWKPAKNFIIWQKLYETYRNLDPVCFSGTIYNLWAPNAEFHVIYCIQIIQLLLSSISLLNIFVLPKSLIIIRNRPSKGCYVCPESEFQNLSFLVLRRKPCRCQDFTIVFVLFFYVAVAVSAHLWVVCRHFCCPMSLFQGHVLLVEI